MRHERGMSPAQYDAGREINHDCNSAFLVPPKTFMALAIWWWSVEFCRA